MRTLLLSILAAILLFVPNAAAHTYLDTTNPTDGAIVLEPVQSIELTYAGKIEMGSTFKVISSNGEQFDTNNITLVDGVLTGTFETPLPNDDYTVQWNSISEDGHPLSGEFSFTVDAPVIEEVVEDEAVEEAEIEDVAVVNVTESAEADQQEESNNSSLLIIGGILALVILIAIIMLVKRKNTK